MQQRRQHHTMQRHTQQCAHAHHVHQQQQQQQQQQQAVAVVPALAVNLAPLCRPGRRRRRMLCGASTAGWRCFATRTRLSTRTPTEPFKPSPRRSSACMTRRSRPCTSGTTHSLVRRDAVGSFFKRTCNCADTLGHTTDSILVVDRCWRRRRRQQEAQKAAAIRWGEAWGWSWCSCSRWRGWRRGCNNAAVHVVGQGAQNGATQPPAAAAAAATPCVVMVANAAIALAGHVAHLMFHLSRHPTFHLSDRPAPRPGPQRPRGRLLALC